MNIRCGSDVTPSVATIYLDSAKRTEEKEKVALTGTMIGQPLVARVAPVPEIQTGRLPHYVYRGLLNVHSRYGLHTRGVAS